jgi:phosphatidylserine/phosphatidylglycerophosphate/cardiolipin synthase-like enzyme
MMSKNLPNTESKALKLIQKEGITRYLSRQANVERRNKIREFDSYVGSDGKGSTSPAGMAISIDRAIKDSFGVAVAEMNEWQLNQLIMLENSAIQIIENGMKANLPRVEIRQRIFDVIKLNKQQYDIINGDSK